MPPASSACFDGSDTRHLFFTLLLFSLHLLGKGRGAVIMRNHPLGSFCHHPWSLQAAPWPVTFTEGGCQAAAVSPNPVPPVQARALLFMDSLTKLSFNRLLSHGSPLSYPGLRNPGTKGAGRPQSIVSQESQTRLSD